MYTINFLAKFCDFFVHKNGLETKRFWQLSSLSLVEMIH